MKKSTKFGLASTAIYTATSFALPVFANTVEQPVFQPVDVSQVTTLEQAENIYSTKLVEYAQDNKITIDEITQLDNINKKKKSLLQEKEQKLAEESCSLMERPQKLYKEVEVYKGRLMNLDSQLRSPNVKESLQKTLERFEKEVLAYYPGLIKKDKGVVYSAEARLRNALEPAFNKIISETNKLLKDNYGDDSIAIFLDGVTTVGDVIAFYEVLQDKISTIKDDGSRDDKMLVQEKQRLEKKIASLESEINSLTNSEHMTHLNSKLKTVCAEIKVLANSPLEAYTSRLERIQEFLKEGNKDLSKYLAVSVYDFLKYYNGRDDWVYSPRYRKLRKEIGLGKEVISDVQSYFKDQGFDVKIVDKLHNPARPKWPYWFVLPVLVAPFIRNIILLGYLGGGEPTDDDTSRGFGYGALETVLFWGFLDAIHPLVLPIRMAAVPLIWHGLLSATGADKAIYDYAK